MKKSVVFLTVSAIVLMGLVWQVAAEAAVKVTVDGSARILRPAAVLRGGTVYVPAVATASAMGFTLTSSSSTTVTFSKAGRTVTLARSRGVSINGSLYLSQGVLNQAFSVSSVWYASSSTLAIATRRSGG